MGGLQILLQHHAGFIADGGMHTVAGIPEV